MKNLKYYFVLACFGLLLVGLTTPTQAQTECLSPPANLVNWWPGDGNTDDIIGGDQGLLVGNATFATGKVQTAFSLDGTGDYIATPSRGISGANPRTIDAWIKTTFTSNSQIIVSYGGPTRPSTDPPFPLGNFVFFVQSNGLGLDFINAGIVYFASGINDGNWHHVSIVVPGSRIRDVEFYMDGVRLTVIKAAKKIDIFTISTGTEQPVRIGRNRVGAGLGDFYFNGLIDEVEIFGRALSASEIQAIYNAGSAGKCKPGQGPVDTTPPTITLNGENPLTLECGTAYSEPGAVITDDTDPNPALGITGSVDSNLLGAYSITYTATDASGNTFSTTRTVNVVDTTPPTITINGENPISLECGVDSYSEPGADVTDVCDPDPSLNITGNVDSHVPGSYSITYTATDASGNSASTIRTVNVVDTTPPSVSAAFLPLGEDEDDEGDDGEQARDDDKGGKNSAADDEDGDDGNGNEIRKGKGNFEVDFTVADLCDPNPVIIAVIEIPNVPEDAEVEFELADDSESSIKFRLDPKKNRFKITLEGSDEVALRTQFEQAIALGGFPATDGQVLRLESKVKNNKEEHKFQFENGVLSGVKVTSTNPDISLKVTATDVSDNEGMAIAHPVFEAGLGTSMAKMSNEVMLNRDLARVAGSGEPSLPLPEDFGLSQNYPNPFNPETEIRFQLPKTSHVVVRIFNTVGQEIRRLADAQYEAGFHSVRWDGKDKNGNHVSSGVYLYQLQAGRFSQVKKMSLLR